MPTRWRGENLKLVRVELPPPRRRGRPPKWTEAQPAPPRRTHTAPSRDHDGRRAVAAALLVDGGAVKRAREACVPPLSQRALADELGLSRGFLHEVERGTRNPPARLARWAAMVLRGTRAKEVRT